MVGTDNPEDDDTILFTKEYATIERNPSKSDRNAERLNLEEACAELFGEHRMIPSGTNVEGEAKQMYLLILPFCVVRPLMEYRPNSTYWEPLSQLKVLDYWMRTPLYSMDANYAKQIHWYGKKEHDSQIRGLAKHRQSGNYHIGPPIDRKDHRFAPAGVSVVFVTHEPHNKRQDMSILLHPVMDGKRIKFLSTFRQEIGPCVLFADSQDGSVTMDALYPPAAIYGTSVDYLIIAQILAVRRHMFNNGPMPNFMIEELSRHTWYMLLMTSGSSFTRFQCR